MENILYDFAELENPFRIYLLHGDNLTGRCPMLIYKSPLGIFAKG